MRRISISIMVFFVLGGCEGEPVSRLMPDAGDPGTDAGPSTTGPAVTTYYEHLRPILTENCTMCHTEGGVAPFSLERYEFAREVGERMMEVTEERIMPPFLADTSGECQEFANHRGLTDDEIATFARWVADGMPEGDSSIPAPDPVELPSIGEPDLTLALPSDYEIRTALDDDYRCFVVEPDLTSATYVTGYDVHPGNEQRVHHVVVYNPATDRAGQAARDRDAAEGEVGDGYECFGDSGVGALPMVIWIPGVGAVRYPRGTGIEMEPGRPQIIQIHYNNILVEDDAPTSDRTTVDLITSDSATPAYWVPLLNDNIELPPRMESVTQTQTTTGIPYIPDVPFPSLRIFGSMPHMHTLGRQLRVDLTRPDGSEECLINVPRWDFNWQLSYMYEEPVSFSPTDDEFTITCTYNTMERDETVRWGDGTLDEMCLNFFYGTL